MAEKSKKELLNDRRRSIYFRLTDKHELDSNTAKAILANLEWESGGNLNPSRRQGKIGGSNQSMTEDDWWKEVWDKDRTIILTKEEHSSKKTSNHIFNYEEEVFELDWTLGLFQCAKQVGFDYVQGREGYFIKNNFEELV